MTKESMNSIGCVLLVVGAATTAVAVYNLFGGNVLLLLFGLACLWLSRSIAIQIGE